ncbi:High-affinity glucose transporter rgt2 [Blyttiomyces sp. JEL0837]|nr:High-affinity glucose transporter rgt2 [Blyttiomyces sp. JEL0837]
MGGLLFGYEIGVIGQVLGMNSFRRDFGLGDFNNATNKYDIDDPKNSDLQSAVTGTFLVGCVLGAAAFMMIVDTLGRKRSILVGGTLFAIGGAIQAAAPTFAALLVGRVFSGLAIGTVSMVVPVYLAETAPTNIRGSLTTVYQLMITFGIFVATCINSIIIKSVDDDNSTMWRAALGAQVAPSVLLVILVAFIPFSPRWLAEKDRNDEAKAVIAKLRGGDITTPAVVAEYEEIVEHIQFERRVGSASWSELLLPGLRYRVLLGIVNQAFQQFTGINVILYYSATIFKYMGFANADTLIAFPLANSAVNFLATFPGMWAVEKFGRKPLLVWGGVGMGVSHALVYAFLTGANNGNQSLAWGAIFAVYGFLFFFASTWGPVVWSYQAEIFPLRVRAKGAGISTMANWSFNTVVAFAWPKVFDKMNQAPTAYWIFASFCFAMALWAYLAVPETKGKSLEELDEVFGDNAGASSTGNVELGIEKK